jgi:hypothetical protein
VDILHPTPDTGTPDGGESMTGKCSSCGGGLSNLGTVPFRVGGPGAAGLFFMGQWAEMSERKYPIDIYRCDACGHLEMFDHQATLPDRAQQEVSGNEESEARPDLLR